MADNSYLSRTGQVNQAGDVFALFKDQFTAEVMTEFEEHRKMIES